MSTIKEALEKRKLEESTNKTLEEEINEVCNKLNNITYLDVHFSGKTGEKDGYLNAYLYSKDLEAEDYCQNPEDWFDEENNFDEGKLKSEALEVVGYDDFGSPIEDVGWTETERDSHNIGYKVENTDGEVNINVEYEPLSEEWPPEATGIETGDGWNEPKALEVELEPEELKYRILVNIRKSRG